MRVKMKLAEAPGLGVPGLPIWIDKSLEGSLYPVSPIDSAVNRSTRVQTIRMPVTFQLQGDGRSKPEAVCCDGQGLGFRLAAETRKRQIKLDDERKL
jgi:hypothetical protein